MATAAERRKAAVAKRKIATEKRKAAAAKLAAADAKRPKGVWLLASDSERSYYDRHGYSGYRGVERIAMQKLRGSEVPAKLYKEDADGNFMLYATTEKTLTRVKAK